MFQANLLGICFEFASLPCGLHQRASKVFPYLEAARESLRELSEYSEHQRVVLGLETRLQGFYKRESSGKFNRNSRVYSFPHY